MAGTRITLSSEDARFLDLCVERAQIMEADDPGFLPPLAGERAERLRAMLLEIHRSPMQYGPAGPHRSKAKDEPPRVRSIEQGLTLKAALGRGRPAG